MENQESNAALVLPMGNEIINTETVASEAPRVVKCKPGQGKLNRMIAKLQVTLQSLGYSAKRFKRDYETGTASYTCPTTGRKAFVNIHTKEVSGDALTTPFSTASETATSEVSNG